MTPETCPNCGAEVPPRAKSCPECGADEATGWNDRATEQRLGVTWLVGFVLACVWAAFSAPHVTPDDGLTGGWLVSGVALFFAWLLGMAATGYLLTRRGRSRTLLTFVPGGWLLMGLWVSFLATMPVPGTPDNDNGVAVGVVLMAVPAIAVLALLAGIGFAMARLVGRLSKRASDM